MDIDRLRDGYRPAARRGAILFFVLSEMALANAMYQYSLIVFLEVFGLSLKKSLPDSILMKRLQNIMDTLTFNIYNYGCTGERLSALIRTDMPCACAPLSVCLDLFCLGCEAQFPFIPSLKAPSPNMVTLEEQGVVSGVPHVDFGGDIIQPLPVGQEQG